MQQANPKQIKVFNVSGSLNHPQDIAVKTTAPTANPKILDGHISP